LMQAFNNNTHKYLARFSLALFTVWLAAAASFAQPPRPVPPAPVPEAVLMPRPTEAEVDQARAALSQFLADLDGDAKRVFTAYPYLLEVRPPGINTAIVPNLAPNFAAKHEANKQVAAAG